MRLVLRDLGLWEVDREVFEEEEWAFSGEVCGLEGVGWGWVCFSILSVDHDHA